MQIPTAQELLELDIDLRIMQLWVDLLAVPELTIEVVGQYVRAAYGMGYIDALKEPEDVRGELCRKHGYKIPTPRQAA